MKLGTLTTVTVLAAALPALAAPTCASPQVVQGNNCTLSTSLGWVAAGSGIASLLTIYVPPNASGPIDFEVTALNSSLGSAYTGYFGFKGNQPGNPGSAILTLADIVAGGPNSIGLVDPGQETQFLITQVCWDPTCTSAAPAGAVPNMFSVQFSASSPISSDISLTPNPMLTVQFLNGSGGVTFEETETSVRSDSPYTLIPGINLGAAPAGRYVYTGAAVNLPFDAISVSNLNNANSISGTLTIQDVNANTVATAPIPSIPPGGAAGYLVIGRSPGDTLGLFPSSTVLPAGTDGIFHGTLLVSMDGLTVDGQCIVLAQEYNGNTMLNLPVFHSPVP